MNVIQIIILYGIGVNVIAYILMGVDKHKAKKHTYRISERTLWGCAIIGGSIGALVGMKQFRHKTKHRSFVIGMPLLITVQVILVTYFALQVS